MPSAFRLALTLILLFALAVPVAAQDPAEPADAETDPAAAPADEADEAEPDPLEGHREVYIPFKNLADVFEEEGQGVFVPYAEFIKLWEANLDRRPAPAKPPVSHLVTRATYTGAVEGDLAVVGAELEFETFTEGWSAVPLGFGGIALGSAEIGGKPATVEKVKDGYRVLVPERGAYKLTVRFVTSISRTEDQRSLTFKVPATPVSRLMFDVPEEGARVTVEPNLATTRTGAEPGVTRVMAFVGAAGEIKLSWKPKPAEVTTGPALVFADTIVSGSVEETALRVKTTVDYKIHRAPIESLKLEVPQGAKVLFVEGEHLKSWDIEAGILTVMLHEPKDSSYRLSLTLEADLPETGAVAVPAVRPLGVARDQGFVVVRAPATVKVLPAADGLFRTDFAEVPESARAGDLIVAYRYPAHPFKLDLTVTRIEPIVDVTGRTLITLDGRRLTSADSFTYVVSRVPVFQLRLALPSDLEVTDVARDHVDDWRIEEDDDGARVLILELKGSRVGAFAIRIASTRPLVVGEEPLALDLPLVTPLGVRRIDGLVGVAREESLKLSTGEVAGLVPVEASSFGQGAAVAFKYRQAERSAKLTVTRRDPEVTAKVATELRAEPNRIAVTSRITWTVKYAGVEEFAFTLPEAVRERVHVTGNNIREKPMEDIEAVEGEEARFKQRIVLQGKVTGDYTVVVEHDLPYEGLEVGDTTDVDIPALIVLDVKREEGVYAVYRDAALEVKETPDRIETIDIRELPAGVDRAEVFLAFEYLAHPHGLSLSVEKHEYLDVLVAAVLHQHIVTVLNDEGAARTEVILVLKNNGLQFLKLSMKSTRTGEPIRPDSLDLFVWKNGRLARKSEVPQAGADGEILVRLPAEAGPETVFYVKLVYPVREDVPGVIFHDFVYEAPVIQGGQVPIQGTTWTVYPPVDVKITQAGGSLKLLDRQDSWLHSILSAMPEVFTPSRLRNIAEGAGYMPLPAGVAELAPSGQEALIFGGRALEPTVEVTFADPATFTFLRVVVLLATLAAGFLVLRRNTGTARILFLGAAIGLPLLLVPVSASGMAEVLTAVLMGGVLAGAAFLLRGSAGLVGGIRDRVAAWREPAEADEETVEEPEETPEENAEEEPAAKPVKKSTRKPKRKPSKKTQKKPDESGESGDGASGKEG